MPDNNTASSGSKLPKFPVGNSSVKLPSMGGIKLPSLGNQKPAGNTNGESATQNQAGLGKNMLKSPDKGTERKNSGLNLGKIDLDKELDKVLSTDSETSDTSSASSPSLKSGQIPKAPLQPTGGKPIGLGGLKPLVSKSSLSIPGLPKKQEEQEALDEIPASEISAALDMPSECKSSIPDMSFLPDIPDSSQDSESDNYSDPDIPASAGGETSDSFSAPEIPAFPQGPLAGSSFPAPESPASLLGPSALPKPPLPQDNSSSQQNIFGSPANVIPATNSLNWDDVDLDDMSGKTMTIESFDYEEKMKEADGEKTQINLSAMDDFEPLSGKLIVESGKSSQREYLLVRPETTIGRAAKNDIAISDISMSRHHVAIDKFPQGFRLRDLESGNGTILNGYRVRVAQLRHGDIIEIGSLRFRFEQYGGDPDELWKGDPKIELHPDQPNRVAIQSGPRVPGQAQPQMESMLERQNSGTAVPGWAAAPQMTSPYVMSYGGFRSINSAPLWSSILLIFLLVCLLGSIILSGYSWYKLKSKRDEIQVMDSYIEKMNMDVNVLTHG